MSQEMADYADDILRDLAFQKERICILNEIIDSQKRLLVAYEDEIDLLQEELDEYLGNE